MEKTIIKYKGVDYSRLRKYSMTVEDFEHLADNCSGRCSICEEQDELVIDHDHKTGKIRGLLCSSCNKGLGMFRDSPSRIRNAINYLKKYGSDEQKLGCLLVDGIISYDEAIELIDVMSAFRDKYKLTNEEAIDIVLYLMNNEFDKEIVELTKRHLEKQAENFPLAIS